MKRYLPFLIIGAVLIIAAGSVYWLVRKSKQNGLANTNVNAQSNTASDAHVRGNASAPVTVEEFGDFQCPPCGRMYPELKKIEQEFGEKIKVVFHNFPIVSQHKFAMIAAEAAEAAGFQGKYWEMHDKLYENQQAWATSDDPGPAFIGYAREIGLDLERFTRDMNGPEAKRRVESDMRDGETRGVQATPTFLVNGRMLRPEATSPDGLRTAINVMLRVNQ
ncbi:MAG TPA: thioredoxin domain-containing protein [Pyrinomonadaceae bacterium]|nr:thioredoxin domain-containing protein [Pyrinomonadaceae bacterium]